MEIAIATISNAKDKRSGKEYSIQEMINNQKGICLVFFLVSFQLYSLRKKSGLYTNRNYCFNHGCLFYWGGYMKQTRSKRLFIALRK